MQAWVGDTFKSEIQLQIKRKLSDAGLGWRYVQVRTTITDKEETVRCRSGLEIADVQVRTARPHNGLLLHLGYILLYYCKGLCLCNVLKPMKQFAWFQILGVMNIFYYLTQSNKFIMSTHLFLQPHVRSYVILRKWNQNERQASYNDKHIHVKYKT